MRTLAVPSSSTPSSHQRLCPSCGGVQLTILTSAVVSYDVALEPETRDLVVLSERFGEADWDGSSQVSCPACTWQGILQNALQ